MKSSISSSHRTFARPSFVVLVGASIVLVACSSACSSSGVGTGGSRTGLGDDTSDQPNGDGSGGVSSGGTGNGPDNEFAALFEAPSNSNVTGDMLRGTWASEGGSYDERIKFGADSVTIARKCSGLVGGVTVGAVVTKVRIRILESKQASSGCYLEVTPMDIGVCADDVDYGCFVLDGTTLSIRDTRLANSDQFFKLSDE